MKKFLLAALISLVGVGNVWAEDCPQVVASDTSFVCTEVVFNDSGSTLTSGTTVVWDQADTDFNTSGRPYVITSTTADDPWTAGVIQNASCADQTLCTIVTRGIVQLLLANSTDDSAVDTLIGTSTVAGQAGDYATGANTCALGRLVDFVYTESATDGILGRVFVDVDCD